MFANARLLWSHILFKIGSSCVVRYTRAELILRSRGLFINATTVGSLRCHYSRVIYFSWIRIMCFLYGFGERAKTQEKCKSSRREENNHEILFVVKLYNSLLLHFWSSPDHPCHRPPWKIKKLVQID